MRKLLLLMCFILTISFLYGQNGTLVSVEYKGTISKDALTDSLKVKLKDKLGSTVSGLFYFWATSFYIKPTYDIEMYKVLYNTINESNKPVIASGLVVLPKINSKFPITAYCHGTVFNKQNVPSNLCGAGECFEINIPYLMASEGHIIVAPDYVGMGQSDQFHPYTESKSEAAATLDIMRATKELLATKNTIKHDGSYYITGYSQGGHAAIATLKAINEQNLKKEFDVKFVGAGGSPTDLSNTQYQFIINNPLYPTREYILYCIATARLIDPTIYNTPSDILKSPYDSLYTIHILGQTGDISWIPLSWPDMFHPSAIDEMKKPGNKLELTLAKSNVYDFYNETPLRLYATSEDEQVTNKNSTLCESVMRSKLPWWKKHLIKVDIFSTVAGNDHQTGALFSFLYWTERIRNYKYGIGNNWRSSEVNGNNTTQNEDEFLISPISELFLQIKNNNEIVETVEIINAENKSIKTEKIQQINDIYYIYTGHLKNTGFYKLRMNLTNGSTREIPFMYSKESVIEAEDLYETSKYIEFPVNYMVERGAYKYIVTDETGKIYLNGSDNDGSKPLLLQKENLKPNINYFIELDNYTSKIVYSFRMKTISGINESNASALTVYVDNGNTIRVDSPVSEIKSVELISSEGKQSVYTKTNAINTDGLSKGLYIVRVTLVGGAQQATKIVLP